MIAFVAQIIPWAEQVCDKCKRTEPIDHLVPVVTDGVLTGWTCEWEDC